MSTQSQSGSGEPITPVDPSKVKVDEADTNTNMEEDDENLEADDLAEIDSSNIIQDGRRTRGKQYDFAKLNAEYDGPEGVRTVLSMIAEIDIPKEEEDPEAEVPETEEHDEDVSEMEADESKEEA